MSVDWRYEVERALQRSKKTDLGATAAREGILGLPITVGGSKAILIYNIAQEARERRQEALRARGKRPMVPGKTNYTDLDQQFAPK